MLTTPSRRSRAALSTASIFLTALLSPNGLIAQDQATPNAGAGAGNEATTPSQEPAQHRILLRNFEHDPLRELPEAPALLADGEDIELWMVQFEQRPTERIRNSLRRAGAEVHSYLPENTHLVRAPRGIAAGLSKIRGVRSVTTYQPAFRLEPFLLAELRDGSLDTRRRYNVVVVDKTTDKPQLLGLIRGLGGTIHHEHPGSILLEVSLTGTQLVAIARFNEVLWIDRFMPDGLDMDNVRIQGGANYIESVGGYDGQGIRGHIYEGLEATHPDFTNTPISILNCGDPARHGHATAGIVFGNGTSTSAARGLAPAAQPYYTNRSCVDNGVSRSEVIEDLVETHEVVFTTSSWGSGHSPFYTSISADADDIVFDHDIPWTQSQGNRGSLWSRPQAWAKNIFSVGGFAHRNNAGRDDDSWNGGFGSRGPAADGRMKPEFSAYYDRVHTSDLTGSDGYRPGDDYESFGGTSAATPIVAGHNALAIQMFADGLFSPQRVPGGTAFQNRPHAATLKALQVASARQFVFHEDSEDNVRGAVGFGFPDLRSLYDNQLRMLVVDETDVLTQGASTTHSFAVVAGDPELRVAMSYADPAGNPAAARARVNDLNLRVTAPDGTVYHGNHGLQTGPYSVADGGAPNEIDTLECVFIRNPAPGAWSIRISAPLIAIDSHRETAAVDADYGLCVSLGTQAAAIWPFGDGCTGSGSAPPYCAALNPLGGALDLEDASNEYAHELHTDQALSIDRFEIWMASQSATQTVNVAIYGPSGSGGIGPATSALATSTITVDTTQQFYTATFATPVAIPAGRFYVAVDNSGDEVYLSDLTSGQLTASYFRSDFNSGNWGLTSSAVRRASVRVFCSAPTGTPAALRFDVLGTAEIGSLLTSRISQARPNSAGALTIGFMPNIEIDLATLGAPGCRLLTEISAALPLSIDSAGTTSLDLALPLDSSLLGASVYEQALVIDPVANSLGVVTSRGFGATIGSNL